MVNGSPRATAGRALLRAFAPFGLALLLAVAVVAAGLGVPTAASDRRFWPQPEILRAIALVESGDREDVADGDHGAAIGPLQIHLEYWQDARRSEPGIGGDYQDCRKRAYAVKVFTAYMQRYAAAAWAAGDAQVIARVHNGGPQGATRKATLGYWQRVRRQLGE